MSPRARLELNRGTRIAAAILRIGLVGWACYYFIPLFTANISLGVFGVSGAYTGFSWLANGFMFFCTLLIAWKYYHPLAEMAIFPIFAACGYGMTRFFQDGQIALALAGTITSGIFAGFFIFNLIFLLVMLVQNFKQETFLPAFSRSCHDKVFKSLLAGSVAWAGITAWSYVGFSQVYTVSDPHQANFAISFWGTPSMGENVTAYKTANGIAEMNLYKALDASFYFTTNVYYLTNVDSMASTEKMLNEWAPYGVKAIFCINPFTDNNRSLEDYSTYYHVQQVNDSITALIAWMGTLNSTVRGVIRGVSLDVEGPNYEPISRFPISRDQYDLAVKSYQGILDEFITQTGCTTHLIAMAGTIFDALDGASDHDIDIAQRTVSTGLNWTQYGFMTYMIDEYPSGSLYDFVYHCEVGMRQWGTRLVPWVGWWYDVNLTRGETPQIELPGVYQQSLDQVKIAKSSGVSEVVLAPVRNFLGPDGNATKIQQRLADLVAIKNGFDSFTVPITHNMRIVNNWNLYWRKIVPYYIWSNADVTLDLFMGSQSNWFTIMETCIIVVVIVAWTWWIKKKEF